MTGVEVSVSADSAHRCIREYRQRAAGCRSVVPLVALNAKCTIAKGSEGKQRTSRVSSRVGKSAVRLRGVDNGDLGAEPSGYGTGFVRIAPRDAMALPVVNAAVLVVAQDGKITEARIVTSPVSVVPFRTKKAENLLIRKRRRCGGHWNCSPDG